MKQKNQIQYIKDTENKIEYLRFREMEKYKNDVDVLYTLKTYDIDFRRSFHPNYDRDVEESSVSRLVKSLNIDKNNIITPKQTHTDNIAIIDEKNVTEKLENIDSVITNKRNIILALTYADCTPILLYDKNKKVIANVHSGWRGTVKEIGKKTALKMKNIFNSNMEDIIAVIGPCIGKNNFEVGEDVKKIFTETFKEDEQNYIKKTNNNYLIDTNYINKESLKSIGIKEKNIIVCDLCTVENSDIMHSYRVCKEKSGRNLAIIYLK